MAEKSKRLLDIVIRNLMSEKYSDIYQDVFKNKTGWNNFAYNGGNIQQIEESINAIKDSIEQYDLKPSKEPYNEIKRKKITYNLKKHEITHNVENALERVITILNDKNNCIKNQIVTLDRGHIDLIVNQKGKTAFVELKMWNGNDNPIYAIIESLKNFYLFKYMVRNTDKYPQMCSQYIDEHEIKTVNKLIILAPKEYYIRFNKGKNGDIKNTWESLFKYIKELNEILKKEEIEIQMKYIDLPYELWKNTFKKYKENDLKTESRKIKGKKIYYRIELESHKDKLADIKKQCQYPWENITLNDIIKWR